MGRPRALVAAVAACLLLAGCGSGPSQVGAAFLMGDREVTQDQVQELIDKAVREQPAAQQLAQQHKLDQLGRAIVSQLVVHELVTRAAQREGLAADEQLVNQALAQDPLATPVPTTGVDPSQLPGQIAYRTRDHREAITDQVLMRALAQKYFEKLSVTFDYTSVVSDDGGAQPASMREKAFAKADEMAASPAAAAQVIQADTAAGQQTSIGERVPAVQAPDLAATVVFGALPGTVVAFQPSAQQAAWIVAVIRQRDLSTPQSVDQATEPTASQLVAIGQRLLQPYVDESGLRLNPRYGVWDPVAMDVAASAAETTGAVVSVKGPAQP
ncbi:SurA N-terminal domain-containing protein [Amycolatopsis sp. GM8]|uniref:SurA N-terminal domain-containing protein n=1 Tax=Amycolatopsis sp. GM8 TaxID=2896530 RepID=UPI0027E0B173|nr:SurA N-terminal domain-containing protein [Amycolatopsis sp. GM8]